MSHIVKFSLALATTLGLGGATALMVGAQEVTLSEDVLNTCADYGLNGPACACFFATLAEYGVLQDGDDINVDELLYSYPEDADACAEANPE
jgi:hypothetical protein